MSVQLVIQRYRHCRLLIHESEWVETRAPGILVYVSFGATATRQSLVMAATTILNLPVVTIGLWGDGNGTQSLRQMLAEKDKDLACSIVIVPQANLISKVKSQGKSIQYHGQVEKHKGAGLYNLFCDAIRCEFYDTLTGSEQADPTYMRWKQHRTLLLAQVLDIRLPSTAVFRSETNIYGSFDDTGFPLTTASGEELSKGVVKKLRKQYDAHAKRHQKWLNTDAPKTVEWDQLLPSACVLAGTFGKRQGLELHSDMGPFCHVIAIP